MSPETFATLCLTFTVRMLISVIIFGILILFPNYVQKHIRESEKRDYLRFFLGYLLWYFSQLKPFKKETYGTFEAFVVGVIIVGSFLSLFQDEFLSGLGVEVTGAMITAGVIVKYTNVLDRLGFSKPDIVDESEVVEVTEGADHDNSE